MSKTFWPYMIIILMITGMFVVTSILGTLGDRPAPATLDSDLNDKEIVR